MYGNKFAADDLARGFQENIAKLRSMKKEAKAKNVSPEDFLITPEGEVDAHSNVLENKIQEVSSYAKDDKEKKICEKCKKAECICKTASEEKACEKCKKVECACEVKPEDKKDNSAEDMSYLVDKKAQYVLYQLGKIAGGLRAKKNGFAADMVEATALEIKNKTLAKAAQKFQVVSGLQKMANDAYKKGDNMTGDVISVTIENIKKTR